MLAKGKACLWCGPMVTSMFVACGVKAMWAIAHQWGLPLTFEEVSRVQQECTVCSKRDLDQVPQQSGMIAKGPIPLIRWQIHCTGPLPMSEGCRYVMTHMDTATGLLIAFPTCCRAQQMTKRGLEGLFAAYGWLQVIENNQGTLFTGHALQERVQQLGINWQFHGPYNPTRAGMIERYNSLLKSGLKSDTNSLWGWPVHLQHLNENPWKGALSPADM